jgi:pimeloyl-ACP methyl ester carboxylesterase
VIACIAGKGGIDGIPGDALFGSPSPILPLHMHLAELNLCRTDLMNHDDHPDFDRLAPDKPGDPTILIGHSFGGATAVALAATLPNLAQERNWILGQIAVVLLDGVLPQWWWSPFRPRFEIPQCVSRVACFVRDALAPPYSSQISGDDGFFKRNYHRAGCDHNSIVATAEPMVMDLAKLMFKGTTA